METSVLEHGILRIVVEPVPPLLLTALEGELDYSCAHLVRRATSRDLTGISFVIVDLSRLTFCDSAGMEALLDFRAAQRTCGREVRIVNARRAVRRVFALLGLDDALSA